MKSAAKMLRFPLGGLAKDGSYRDTTYPTEESVYSTPMAKNVIGECAFSGRLRGGSRPGLKAVENIESSGTARWLWPNGEPILWPGGSHWELHGDGDVSHFRAGYLEESGLWVLQDNSREGFVISTSDAPKSSERVVFHASPPDLTFEVVYELVTVSGGHMIFGTFESATLPDGSQIVLSHQPTCLYRDRVFKAEGSVWMASRTGDHGNFDFGGEADDPTKACAGNLAYAGRKGEDITAFAPFGDSRIFIATRRSLAVISGEPTSAMAMVSENVGIVSADAWCNADGALYFIGPNGMYVAAEGSAILVSKQLPEDLKGLDYALLVYDPHYRGIHIFTENADWFFDIERKAFWPVEYPATMMPDAGGLVMVNGVNRTIFHCVDGEWRYWDDSQTTDDGEDIESSVAIGPFKCGVNDDVDGMLDSLNVTLANESANCEIRIYVGKSAEDAVRSSTFLGPYQFGEGWNPVVRPRVRGAWCVIKLYATGKWSYESIQANIKVLGRLRA